MVESASAGNLQATLDRAYLGATLDTDGSINLNLRRNKRNKIQFLVRITWMGTNPEYIEEIARILTNENVPHHVYWTVNKHPNGFSKKSLGRVEIVGFKRLAKVYPVLEGYVRIKAYQLQLHRDFVEYRLQQGGKRHTNKDLELFHKFRETV